MVVEVWPCLPLLPYNIFAPKPSVQSALAKERRELREQQQRTLLEAIPKDLSRPWEDPLADAGERALAQELRGIGLGAQEMPEWKKQASVFPCRLLGRV